MTEDKEKRRKRAVAAGGVVILEEEPHVHTAVRCHAQRVEEQCAGRIKQSHRSAAAFQ
jgi:hypothetical protein